ncbi:MAG TPA: sugar phosphate isomerase/epimerase [bacterium]|nr:sugar phosphate isomerase/epimerase [bacterium]
MSREQNRREFFKTAGVAAAAASLAPSGWAEAKRGRAEMRLGLASYTFRRFGVGETIAITKRLGLSNLCLKSMHMPLDASAEEIRVRAAKVRAAGIDLYTAGVIYMTNASEVQQAFTYAQTAGLKMIVGVPEYSLVELCNQKIKETGIMLAIHNHGPGDQRYPSPGDVYSRIRSLDPRMGLCLDIGHTMRNNEDPSQAAKKYFDRLLDVHIKDVSAASKEGTTVEIGRGVIDIPRFLKTLLKLGYKGVLALEYEKDEEDPEPGSAESVGYIRGVLATLQS